MTEAEWAAEVQWLKARIEALERLAERPPVVPPVHPTTLRTRRFRARAKAADRAQAKLAVTDIPESMSIGFWTG
jgi:hypothetical protein